MEDGRHGAGQTRHLSQAVEPGGPWPDSRALGSEGRAEYDNHKSQ